MRIWDLHCHVDEPRVPGRTFTQKVENTLRIAERAGIERLGLFLRADKEEKEIAQVLERHRDKVFGVLWKLAGTDGICSYPIYEPVFQRTAALQRLI